MDHEAMSEQLAAYAAGELPADERAALEARLAREPALRARLEAIRRADAALAALPAVEPPADFSRRLRATLQEELQRTDDGGDELAARRELRRQRFLRGAGLAAAAAGVVALATIGITSLVGDGGGDDMAATEALDGDAVAIDIIRVSDTDYDTESLGDLAEGSVVDTSTLRGLSQAEAEELARRNTEALGYSQQTAATLQAPENGPLPATSGGDTATGGDGEANQDEAVAESAEAAGDTAAVPEALSDDPSVDVQRCATEIIASTDTLIPLLAEVATFEGEPAVLYLFASPDADDGSFTRLEIWAVARADCAVLHFTQFEL